MTSVREALLGSRTKREAAERLGKHASCINCSVREDPELVSLWRALPADGAYSGRAAGLPRSVPNQAECDALLAEAADDLTRAGHPVDPANHQRHDAVRLLLAVYAITGTLSLQRGWVRSLMATLTAAGHGQPSSKGVRWYRYTLANDPWLFAEVPGVALELLADLAGRG